MSAVTTTATEVSHPVFPAHVPRHPIHHEIFCKEFQDDFKDIVFYELVEGLSIYAHYQNGWILENCENYVDDDLLYHRIKYFKEACNALNVDLERDLDKNFTYSFVFQTPKNNLLNSYETYEMYIVNIYRNTKEALIPCNLEDFTAYKYTYDVACYERNRRILFPRKLIVNFDNLELIVKEWGVGNGLPFEILDNDDYDRHAFIHKRSEKGIAMVHIPSGTKCEVLNRHYVKYIQKQQQKQETN